MNPPFEPPTFPDIQPKGGWSLWTGPWCVLPDNYAHKYNGQTQTGSINTANPAPPQNFSPSAAPPWISQID